MEPERICGRTLNSVARNNVVATRTTGRCMRGLHWLEFRSYTITPRISMVEAYFAMLWPNGRTGAGLAGNGFVARRRGGHRLRWSRWVPRMPPPGLYPPIFERVHPRVWV